MKLNIIISAVISLLSTAVFAADGNWAVPNISYTCTVSVGQDWPSGGKDILSAKSKDTDVFLRGTGVDFDPTDFTIEKEDQSSPSGLKYVSSFKGTDLEDFSVNLDLKSTGNGITLQTNFVNEPRVTGKQVLIVAEDYKSDGIPATLNTSLRIYNGDLEDQAKAGPILVHTACKLKGLF